MVRFVDDHRAAYGVEPICGVVPIPRPRTTSTRPGRPIRVRRDAVLRDEIQRVWDENQQVYGAEKTWRQLQREDVTVASCAVER